MAFLPEEQVEDGEVIAERLAGGGGGYDDDVAAGFDLLEGFGLVGIEAGDAAFLEGAKARGLVTLKGHRAVGGMRASIYNAMPLAGVEALVGWMRAFEAAHG